MRRSAKPIPEGYHTLTPGLVLGDARRALDFYSRAFGAEVVSRMTPSDVASCTPGQQSKAQHSKQDSRRAKPRQEVGMDSNKSNDPQRDQRQGQGGSQQGGRNNPGQQGGQGGQQGGRNNPGQGGQGGDPYRQGGSQGGQQGGRSGQDNPDMGGGHSGGRGDQDRDRS
jgi:hypothetical protein